MVGATGVFVNSHMLYKFKVGFVMVFTVGLAKLFVVLMDTSAILIVFIGSGSSTQVRDVSSLMFKREQPSLFKSLCS